MKRNRVFGGLIRLAIVLVMLAGPLAVLASELDVAVIDMATDKDEVTLAQGNSVSIKIAMEVTGKQGSSASFKIYRDWTLIDGTFVGSNAATFDVPAREAQDAPTVREAVGTISVDANHAVYPDLDDNTYLLEIEAFDIVTSAPATLEMRDAGEFTVIVEAGVGYNFTGFFQPIDMDGWNVARAGRAVPVKFSLAGDQGLDIFADGYPQAQWIACDTSADLAPPVDTVTAGGSSLSYDAEADQYVYVWKTDRTWAGSCRELVIKFIDGQEHTANFMFNK